MKVKVTKDNIDNGLRFSVFNCPVSTAIKRYLPKDAYVIVDGQFAQISDYRHSAFKTVELPQPVKDFIQVFDDYHPPGLEPFEFELDYTLRRRDRIRNWLSGR